MIRKAMLLRVLYAACFAAPASPFRQLSNYGRFFQHSTGILSRHRSPVYIQIASSSSSSSSSAELPSSQVVRTFSEDPCIEYEDLIIGGDYAGLTAVFSSSDGGLIPIPEYLVPPALLEWGQEPSGLEILVSEDLKNDKPSVRNTLTILPEIGCAVDNLEVTKSTETFSELTSLSVKLSDSVWALDTIIDKDKTRVETIFSLPEGHRIRLSLDIQRNQKEGPYKFQSPVSLYLERKTSDTSTHGTRANGGGLDGRTVSTLLGDWLRKNVGFAEQKPILDAWITDSEGSKNDGLLSKPTHWLNFPGNVTIASGPAQNSQTKHSSDWILEISHFTPARAENPFRGIRRIVQRRFRQGGNEIEYREANGEYNATSN